MNRSPVQSSNLVSVGYDAARSVLEVEFTSGGIYQYAAVPASTYEHLLKAVSPGSYFAAEIRSKYPGKRVEEHAPGASVVMGAKGPMEGTPSPGPTHTDGFPSSSPLQKEGEGEKPSTATEASPKGTTVLDGALSDWDDVQRRVRGDSRPALDPSVSVEADREPTKQPPVEGGKG